MKYIFIYICSIILSTISANQIRPKLCIDCKFYKKDFLSSNKFGKCSLFIIKKEENDYFLVDGNNNDNIEEYYYCSTARKYDYMCGKEGKFYEKR
jgi:hypothetical protein